MADNELTNNGYVPANDGYQPTSIEKGYKPASQPQTNNPSDSKPGAGYQPTISQGENPGNPPQKP